MGSPSPPLSSRPVWPHLLLLGGTLFISYAYFFHGTGWNQNSHLYLAQALVEQHTVRIDRYQSGTGDKAYYGGHYYSDKAPGLSLTALPAVWAGLPASRALHIRARDAGYVQLYLAAVFTCSLGIALAAVVLFVMLLGWGVSPGGAGFAVLVLGLGTPMWIYATQLWGHAFASACLVFGFAAADQLRRRTTLAGKTLFAGLTGLAAGWAVVTEYPAAIPAVMIGVMALVYCRRSAAQKKSFILSAAALLLTAGVCLATILLYQRAAFGSPFRLGYEYIVNYQETLRHGELGLSYPKWHALMALLFGKRCGLLLFAPVLLVAPVGFWLLWRGGGPRLSLGVSAGIALYYLLFNASYLYWQAGASFGPRYLSPGLPFACIFLAPVWERSRPALKAVVGALAGFGFAVALAGVTTRPVIPETIRFAVRDALISFSRGNLYQSGGAWNLGLLAGLPGMWSLAPLAAVWGVAGGIWWWIRGAKNSWNQEKRTRYQQDRISRAGS